MFWNCVSKYKHEKGHDHKSSALWLNYHCHGNLTGSEFTLSSCVCERQQHHPRPSVWSCLHVEVCERTPLPLCNMHLASITRCFLRRTNALQIHTYTRTHIPHLYNPSLCCVLGCAPVSSRGQELIGGPGAFPPSWARSARRSSATPGETR